MLCCGYMLCCRRNYQRRWDNNNASGPIRKNHNRGERSPADVWSGFKSRSWPERNWSWQDWCTLSTPWHLRNSPFQQSITRHIFKESVWSLVINVRLSATLFGVNANLDIMLYLFLEDGNVTFGNEAFMAFNGSLKFNIQVSLRMHFVTV